MASKRAQLIHLAKHGHSRFKWTPLAEVLVGSALKCLKSNNIGDPPNIMGSLVFNVRIIEVGFRRPRGYLSFSATRVHDVRHWHQKQSRWHIYLLTFAHGMARLRMVDNKMGVSENSVPLNPMVLLIIIPIKWLFVWEYTG